MTALDPYLAMVHGCQALRRRAERSHGALLGALGVAAEPMPHQTANVARILGAHEIRHLIADGVGLGKTVQTLMILNALRLQTPGHRALLVVPDHLIEQWINELATRGHLAAAFLDSDGDPDAVPDDISVRLVKPSRLRQDPNLLRFGADSFDMLVVDEPQSFTVEQRDALARARPFAQFLALTATPEFGRGDMRRWFLQMLEPTRIGLGKNDDIDPLPAFQHREAAAMREVVAGTLSPALAFARDALGRRICRWSREDWPDYMPQRCYTRANVPPFGREVTLAAQARAVMASHREGREGGTDPVLLAQALHRIGRSARDAVAKVPDALILHGEENNEEDIRGDARFDALLARLAMIHRHDQQARVLIVAGDNDTVARLRRRLSLYLADSITGEEAGIASLARAGQTAGDVEDAIRRSHATLRSFAQGDDRIMLIGDWMEAGLNLHHDCSELIFYSCPWAVRSVDQLIGRLDRLRSNAGRRAERGQAQGRIGLHVITWRGSPEADVVDGLERLGVFTHPVSPATGETEARTTKLLHDLAAGHERKSALAELETLANDEVFDNALSRLARFDPYSAQAARDDHIARTAAPPLPGALLGSVEEGGRGIEESALRGWMGALNQTRLLDTRFGVRDHNEGGNKYSSTWYVDTGTRSSEDTRPIHLDVLGTNPGIGLAGFNMYRRHLSDPPRRMVARKQGTALALNFMDHGDTFHEQLCQTCISNGRAVLESGDVHQVLVEYPPGHSALVDRRPMLVTVALHEWQLVTPSRTRIEQILEIAHEGDRASLDRQFAAMLASDDRWFRLACLSRFFLSGNYIDKGVVSEEEAPTEHVVARLDPRAKEGRVICRPRARPPALSGLPNEVARQRRMVSTVAPVSMDAEAVSLRIAVLDAESAYVASDSARQAVRERARMTEDAKQGRMIESIARRIECRAEALKHFALLRRESVQSAAAPFRNQSKTTVWQLTIHPMEQIS